MYIIRLDDASEYMDVNKWDKIEEILDKYSIKPLVGIIPNNKDKEFVGRYTRDPNFWYKAKKWQEKDWTIALHGYTHVYITDDGGINPVNYRSEFAGVPLKEQTSKISKGFEILQKHDLNPLVFFAPSHTFDMNTLKALKLKTDIRIISDTIANDVYKLGDFYFIPQQSGRVRKLPFKVTTFCYHPNIMKEEDFNKLESFIKKNKNKFCSVNDLELVDREPNLYDKFLRKMYFSLKSIRNIVRGR